MAFPKAFPIPKSLGQQLTPAEINLIDAGQADRISASQPTTIDGDCGVVLDAHDFNIGGSTGGFFKPEANDTKFTGTGWPGFNSTRSMNYTAPCTVLSGNTLGVEYWVEESSWITQVNNSGPPVLSMWLSLPPGARITGLLVGLEKVGGSLPVTMPRVGMFRQDLTTGLITSVISYTDDTSATLLDYQTYHIVPVTVTLPGILVAENSNYIVSVIGDSNSTSTANGLRVYRPRVALTFDSLRQV
jgi:hypothetical protein